jgi:hypothetical protein
VISVSRFAVHTWNATGADFPSRPCWSVLGYACQVRDVVDVQHERVTPDATEAVASALDDLSADARHRIGICNVPSGRSRTQDRLARHTLHELVHHLFNVQTVVHFEHRCDRTNRGPRSRETSPSPEHQQPHRIGVPHIAFVLGDQLRTPVGKLVKPRSGSRPRGVSR